MASKYIIIVEDDGKQDPIPFDEIEQALRLDLDSGLHLKNIYSISEIEIRETQKTIIFDCLKGA